jgi:DNA modification methylase
MTRQPLYTTELGAAYLGDSLTVMAELPADSVDLVVTSPPYALHFKKEYGNADQADYVAWLSPFCQQIRRILKPTGSFVLNIGGAWTPGAPARSLYVYRLVLHLCDVLGFTLCQEMFWYNPAKMPAPAEWVTVRRIRVKDSVEYLFWFGKTPFPKAHNSRVLQPYSPDMLRLIQRGVKRTKRPSGHNITHKFSADHGGSIPGNLIECGNNESNSDYMKRLKETGRKIHPARFPAELPRFFVQFLTEPGDLVLDPFAGSNTTGAVAESLGRRWTAIELDPRYLEDSRLRFEVGVASDDEPAEPQPRQLRLVG